MKRPRFLSALLLIVLCCPSAVAAKPADKDAPSHGRPSGFQPSRAMERRYWLVDDWQAKATDESWSLDFMRKDEPGSLGGNYGDELARLVSERSKGRRELDQLSALAVRRADRYGTLFVATHEPFANNEKPGISNVTVVAQTGDAMLVRVDSAQFTDYAAVAFHKTDNEHTLGDGQVAARFRNYGYLRVSGGGAVTARGQWTGLPLPLAGVVLRQSRDDPHEPRLDAV